MIEKYLKKFSVDLLSTNPVITSDMTSVAEFLETMSNYSWNGGLYRTLEISQQSEWKKIIGDLFDGYEKRVVPFGYDWLGRMYCLDASRVQGGQPFVLLIDPSPVKVYEIPANITGFYNDVLVDNYDQVLEPELFDTLICKNSLIKNYCFGLNVPEFLGGEFTAKNLDLIDLRLYWQLITQIWKGSANYPNGTSIKSVTLSK
jgi:hypothetical protein